MITFLKGTIEDSGENYLAVNVNGVGYELTATMNAVFKYTALNGEVKIPTYMVVREDSVTLYGFADNSEKEIFLKLISVSGVGPKGAIVVLSSISTADLCLSIATGDVTTLSKVKGLGKKTAEKIIVELREKIGKIDNGQVKAIQNNALNIDGQAVEDACVALQSLGLSSADAVKLVQKVAEPEMTAEDIIKKCLKDMAR